MIKHKHTQDVQQWHKWFAWYPVSTNHVLVGDSYRWTTVWWDYVYRCTAPLFVDAFWQYRIIPKTPIKEPK